MVSAGEVDSDDVIVEVGPGLGTLTKKLCETAQRVIAVELDDDLAHQLPERVTAQNLEVVHQSILDFDTTVLPKWYKVIANIPYYLTSNLIRRLLESKNPPAIMVLLIQKEVAERVVAKPGSMSILSVATQFYAEVSLREIVPARLFTPPPKVDSQIIQIKYRTEPLFEDVDTSQFFKVVRAGFSEKRKKLRSSLSGSLRISKEAADNLLQTADIPLRSRAQELTLKQWYQLYKTTQK